MHILWMKEAILSSQHSLINRILLSCHLPIISSILYNTYLQMEESVTTTVTFWKQTVPSHRTNQLNGDSIPSLLFTVATNSSTILYSSSFHFIKPLHKQKSHSSLILRDCWRIRNRSIIQTYKSSLRRFRKYQSKRMCQKTKLVA